MKKKNIISYYSFLGGNVKTSALSEKKTRDEFIRFFRELRKAVTPIFDELNDPDGKLPGEVDDEVRKAVLEEDFSGEIPTIDEDIFFEVIAESGIDAPILAVINDFGPFLK